MSKTRLSIVAAAVCILFSSVAFADEASGYSENQVGKDQSVIFKDDPLAAGGFGPHDPHIAVRLTPRRVTLIRPRTQFVTEMLKSVESL